MTEVMEISNRAEFQEHVLQSDLPVMVGFCLDRHRGSRRVATELDHLARDYGDQVLICRIDADNADLLMADWKVRTTPTVILFLRGEPVKRWGNGQDEQEYRKALDRLVTALWQK